MDGNRRFARKYYMHTSYGYQQGAEIFWDTVYWCLILGIPEVTMYAFSIDNFKRSTEEVEALTIIANTHFTNILKEIDNIKDLGIRIHFVGRHSLFSDELNDLIARIMLATRHHTKIRLNIACPYTGRDEISRAASHLVDAVHSNKLQAEDIDESLVSHVMELGEPELLIRTSGEVRLSDFMLWQISNTVLYFTDVLWPEFSIYDLFTAIIHFQNNAPKVKETEKLSERKQKFLEDLDKDRWRKLEEKCSIQTKKNYDKNSKL